MLPTFIILGEKAKKKRPRSSRGLQSLHQPKILALSLKAPFRRHLFYLVTTLEEKNLK